MTAVSNSRRSLAGIVLIVAGVFFLLAIILPLAGVAAPWLVGLAYAAMAVALVILALGALNSTLAKIALFIGAVGFAILALAAFGIALPGILLTIAAVIAALGFLVGAIVVYVGKEIGNTSAIIFLIAAILAAIILLTAAGALGLGVIATVLTVALAIALIIAGVYFRRKGSRR